MAKYLYSYLASLECIALVTQKILALSIRADMKTLNWQGLESVICGLTQLWLYRV